MFADSPDLNRYLLNASLKETDDGIVIGVPTSFQMNGLRRHISGLEKALRCSVIGIEVAKLSPPRTREDSRAALSVVATNQNFVATKQSPIPFEPLSIVEKNPMQTVQKESEKRLTAPELLTSNVFDQARLLIDQWAHGVNDHPYSTTCLWVHGHAGSGKTSQLRQLHELIRMDKRITHVDTMSFFTEWREALQTKTTPRFVKKYRTDTDVLILENIEELRGKHKTQEEVLFTISSIFDRGGAVAVSSSEHPQSLREAINPQLFSRLFSGMCVELPRPDRSFMEQLWRKLVDQFSVGSWPVDLRAAEKLYSIRVDSARVAHTLCINAIARLSLNQCLKLEDIHSLEAQHCKQKSALSAGESPLTLLEQVAKACGVSASAIKGGVRRSDVAIARRFACLALSRFLGLTNSAIAVYVEKDPSTICHALKTIEKELESDRHIAKQWNWICSQLGRE
ncbi:MAG TPA: DnaA/Hda family protein [Bdellovibrionota bacterium]|nr:DnaA/Hda family protein [Bdellovibrionota bacterium]